MGFVYLLSGVKEIDIAATLEHIRDQRPGLVRTKVPSLWLCLCVCPVRYSPNPTVFSLFYFPLPFSLPSCPPPLNPALSDQDQFEFALTAVAEEVNAILKALPQWAALVWTHSCDANTYVWKITVNKKLLHHTGSSYCSCFQHAVFHRLLILWVVFIF